MGPHDHAEPQTLWPPTPGALQELQLTWTRERATTGHTLWRYSIGAWCETCGPTAIAVGPAPPFASQATLGAASQRLVRCWAADSTTQGSYREADGGHHHRQLLDPFHEHLELHHRLE